MVHLLPSRVSLAFRGAVQVEPAEQCSPVFARVLSATESPPWVSWARSASDCSYSQP